MAEAESPSHTSLVLERLLTGEGAFDELDRLLCGLTAEQTVMVPAGCHHSIALSVAHMSYWLRLYLGWIHTGQASERAAWGPDFVTPPAEQWPEVLAEFQTLVTEARALAADPGLAERRVSVDGEPVPAATLLGDLGAHNAYHLGQIVLLRRLLGAWPPAG